MIDPLTFGVFVGVALSTAVWAMILYIVKKD